MEKLIELLNEYDNGNWGVTDYGDLFNKYDEGISETEDLQVISKKFGFIKWLIENDKIDFEKLENLNKFNDILYLITVHYGLLMILSIQDDPVEFLISILK